MRSGERSSTPVASVEQGETVVAAIVEVRALEACARAEREFVAGGASDDERSEVARELAQRVVPVVLLDRRIRSVALGVALDGEEIRVGNVVGLRLFAVRRIPQREPLLCARGVVGDVRARNRTEPATLAIDVGHDDLGLAERGDDADRVDARRVFEEERRADTAHFDDAFAHLLVADAIPSGRVVRPESATDDDEVGSCCVQIKRLNVACDGADVVLGRIDEV
jgi:hypothetical protein